MLPRASGQELAKTVYLVYSGSIVPMQPLAWGKEDLLLPFESPKVRSAACPACQVRDQSLPCSCLGPSYLPCGVVSKWGTGTLAERREKGTES